MSIQRRINSTFRTCAVMALALHSALARELPVGMLNGLAAQEYTVREAAQSSLLEWSRQKPKPAMEELYRQSRTARDPEVRQRCQAVLRELVMDEYLEEGEGYIGIEMDNELANVPGKAQPCNVIRVKRVVEDSAAQKAGLQVNDLIAGLENEFWHDGPASLPFADLVRARKPNTKIALQVLREGELIKVDVVLGRRPMMLNHLFFNQSNFDPDAAETAAKEAYFRRWMSQRSVPD